MSRKDSFANVMERHAETVWRVCRAHMPQKADAEDAFQTTFVRYATSDVDFNGDEHVKAWLIRVATNVCLDMLKASAAKAELTDQPEDLSIATSPSAEAEVLGTSDAPGTLDPPQDEEPAPTARELFPDVELSAAAEGAFDASSPPLRRALLRIPANLRTPLYLTYYEGMRADSIAQLLNQPVNTVYSNLARGRKALKEALADES